MVKMISSKNKKKSREDWYEVRLKIMKWCISIKLAQNFVSFGSILHETGLKNIVENSAKDNFWGAIPDEDGTIFTGINALGRLLMDLRQAFYSKDNFSLLFVEPPQIKNFLLYNDPIGTIDERSNFVKWLLNYWGGPFKNYFKIPSHTVNFPLKDETSIYVKKDSKMIIAEESQIYTSKKAPKQKQHIKKKKQDTATQADLFLTEKK